MAKRKDILTTGQVAEICKVAPRTVTKWFDTGQLRGYRIPGSRDRRIPKAELIRFMKVHNMPTDTVEYGRTRVLVIDADWEMASALAKALKGRKDYNVQIAQNSFDAGITAQKLNPHVVLISLLTNQIDAAQICRNLRSSEDLQAAKVIAVAEQLSDREVAALLQKGFDGFIPRNAELEAIIRTIEGATAILY